MDVELLTGKPKLPASRWFFLSFIGLLSFSNAANWLNYNCITAETAAFYKTSTDTINIVSLVYMILAIVTMVPSVLILNKCQMFVSILLVAVLQGIGGIIKFVGPYIMPPVPIITLFIGHILIGSCGAFVMVMATKYPTIAFQEDEQTTAVNVVTISNFMGILFAYGLIPFVWIKTKNIYYINLATGLPCLIGLLLCPFLICEPTMKNNIIEENGKSWWKNTKTLFKNKDYMILSIGFGLAVGLMGCFVTYFQQIFTLLDFSLNTETIFIVVLLVSGAIFSFILTVFIDKKGSGYFILIVIQLLSGLSMNIMLMAIYSKWNFSMGLAISIMFGLFAVPLPAIYQMEAVKITSEVPPAMSSGFMWLLSQFFGAIIGIIMLKTISMDEKYGKPVLTTVVLSITLSFVSFIMGINGLCNKNMY